MAEEILKRENIQEKDKWDLSAMCQGEEEFLKVKQELLNEIPEIEKFKGKLSDRESLLQCLRLDSKISSKLMKIYAYAMQLADENTKDSKAKAMEDMATNVYGKYAVSGSFISVELSELSEDYIESLVNDKDFSNFDIMLKDISRVKKYTLSEKEEKLLATGSEVFGCFHDIFNQTDNADMVFPKVKDENGELSELSHSKYSLFLSSDDREVRKNAYEAYYNEYKKLIHTISATYIGSVKKDVFLAKVRGFESALDKSMFYENVDKKVYEKLLENVEKALPTLHDYIDLRQKAMGVDQIAFYDLYVSLIENVKLKLDFSDAYALVKKALLPLGEDYQNLLTEAYENRWIDVYATEGKRSGAYSNSVYGVHPYVLLNYEKTAHDVFTTAHEMGHAMHSYYSNANQVYEKADYTIFVAEVASTVNEVLLLRHLIGSTTDKEMKKFCLNYFLDMFRTTLFRQTMFAEFEFVAHTMCEKDIPMTYEGLSSEYEKLNKKYYGESILHDDFIKYEWARIPHFYRNYYVYKYSTGIISAISIAYSILEKGEEAVAKYKEFLSSGCSDKPTELLKIAGVDLTTNTPYEKAFEIFKATLDELKELM